MYKRQEEGASVAICARGQEGVDEALAELQGKGTVIGQAVDVGNGDELETWLKRFNLLLSVIGFLQ